MDGLEICRAIREESNTPILMLTARTEEADEIVGLELGADDYIVKPFSPREIVARVRTILRRTNNNSIPVTIKVGSLVIDIEKHTVCLSDRLIDLTPTEFDILVILANQPSRVFSRLQLLENALGISFDGYDRTIDGKNIRNKLEPNPRKPIYIQTVFGLGYKFEMSDDANSLILKLMGAFLLLVFISALVISVSTAVTTRHAFDQYSTSNRNAFSQRLASNLADFYAASNSWQGVDEVP